MSRSRAAAPCRLRALLSVATASWLLLVAVVLLSASGAADLSESTTTSPSWGLVGQTVDISVSNVYAGVIVQVWIGADACGSPETARLVASARVPSGTPPNSTLVINVPANSVFQGYYSVCAADMNSPTNVAQVPSFALRQRMALDAVEKNRAQPLWTYEQVGTLNVAGLSHTPTQHDVDELLGVFFLQLNHPAGSGVMEQLCTSPESCATPLSSAAAAELDEANLEYLLSVLRVSLFYINPQSGTDRCPSVTVINGAVSSIPQGNVTVAPGGTAGVNKWMASATIASFDSIEAALDGEAKEFMTCAGPTEVIAPSPDDDAYQGHTLAGWTTFLPAPVIPSSSSSSSSGVPVDEVLPTSLVRGEAQAFVLRDATTGAAALAADVGCANLLSSVAPLADGQATLQVPLCTTNPIGSGGENGVYFCADTSATMPSSAVTSGEESFAWQVRGVIRLLSLYNCATQQPENVLPVTVEAATPITQTATGSDFGVAEGFALAPFLSTDRDCATNGADAAYVAAMAALAARGFVSGESANASVAVSDTRFYVCVTSPDGTLHFTTAAPTLTVTGYALSPRQVAVNVTAEMHLQPLAQFPNWTFLTKDCAGAELPALGDVLISPSPPPPQSDLILPGGAALGAGTPTAVTVRVTGAPSSSSSSNAAAEEEEEEDEALLAALGIYRVCTPQQVLPAATAPQQQQLSNAFAADATSAAAPLNGTTPDISFAYASVQSFLAVAPPAVRFITAPVVDSVMCAAVTVPGGYYSVVPGVDGVDRAFDAYRPYYLSEERAFYLQAVTAADVEASVASGVNLCAGGYPTDSGSAAGEYSDLSYARADDDVAPNSATVCFNTTGLRAAGEDSSSDEAAVYMVCAGTPSGFQQQPAAASALPVANVSPTELIAGATTRVSIPDYPTTDFLLVSAGAACEVDNAVVTFATDAAGEASLAITSAVTGEPLPAGAYTLCFHVPQFSASAPWQRLRTWQVVSAPNYTLSMQTLVSQVPAVVQLGTAMQVAFLRPGFYMDTACAQPLPDDGNVSATWTAVAGEGNVILVSATLAVPPAGATAAASAPLYLCATDPVNGSLVAFPTTAASPPLSSVRAAGDEALADGNGIKVISNPMILASMQVATCTNTNAYFRDSTGTENYLVSLVDGPCCVSTTSVVQQGVATGMGYRTFFVNDSVLEAFAPQRQFAVCVQAHPFAAASAEARAPAAAAFATGLCYTPGDITFFAPTPSQCLSAGFAQEMPVLGVGARKDVLGRLVPVQLNRVDVTGSEAYTWTGLIVLAVIAGCVFLVLLLVAILCALCTRRTRPIPADEKEKEEAMPPLWRCADADAMRHQQQQRRRDEASDEMLRAALSLSFEDIAARINLRLNRDDIRTAHSSLTSSTARRTPEVAADDAAKERANVEEEPRGREAAPASAAAAARGVGPLGLSIPSPPPSAKASSVRTPASGKRRAQAKGSITPENGSRRSSVPLSTSSARATAGTPVGELAERERLSRRRILEEEDNELLMMLDEERRLWRGRVELEGKRIRSLLKEDPFWASRFQALEEVNTRTLQSVMAGECSTTSDADTYDKDADDSVDSNHHHHHAAGLLKSVRRGANAEEELSVTQLDSEEKDQLRGQSPERRGQTGWPASPFAAARRASPSRSTSRRESASVADPDDVVFDQRDDGTTPLQRLARYGGQPRTLNVADLTESETTRRPSAAAAAAAAEEEQRLLRSRLAPNAASATHTSDVVTSDVEDTPSHERSGTSDDFSTPSLGHRGRSHAPRKPPLQRRLSGSHDLRPGPNMLDSLLQTIQGASPVAAAAAKNNFRGDNHEENQGEDAGRPAGDITSSERLRTCVEAPPTAALTATSTSTHDLNEEETGWHDDEVEVDTFSAASANEEVALPRVGTHEHSGRQAMPTLPHPPPPPLAHHSPPPPPGLVAADDSAHRDGASLLYSPPSASSSAAAARSETEASALARQRDHERLQQQLQRRGLRGVPPPPPPSSSSTSAKKKGHSSFHELPE